MDVDCEEGDVKTGFVSASCKGERCSLCGKPAHKKIGEEIPHDDPYPNRHNCTAYVCQRHYNQIMFEHSENDSSSPDKLTTVVLWFPGDDWVSIIPIPSYDAHPMGDRRILTHTLFDKTNKIAFARVSIEYLTRTTVTLSYKNCSLNRDNGIVPGELEIELHQLGYTTTGTFFDRKGNKESFYYSVTGTFLNQEPIDEEYEWCEYCDDEMPLNHTCVP